MTTKHIPGVGAALAVAAFALSAAAGAPAPSEDIRDIRPLILIPPWWYWAAAAAAATVVVVGCILGYREWRRRTRRPLTAEEQALESLAQAELLAREGRCREWADVVARAVRTALAARLRKESCPETTEELASLEWSTVGGAPIDASLLVGILSTCDLARFALARLERDSLLTSTESAREWVTGLFAVPAASSASTVPATSTPVTPSAAREPRVAAVPENAQ
ncbi:MAG TPA: hypothetical protein VH062_15120 [Polyangiaceae bacterium]|nr:hypothetical protein [Polyangiaceae bacterium]